MPTRPIPTGSVNATANMPAEQWRQFRRLAFLSNQSAGARLRDLIERDLAAARVRGLQLLRDTRQMILPLGLCLIVAAGFAGTIAAAVVGASEMRRPAITRVLRTVRSLKIRHRREPDAAEA